VAAGRPTTRSIDPSGVFFVTRTGIAGLGVSSTYSEFTVSDLALYVLCPGDPPFSAELWPGKDGSALFYRDNQRAVSLTRCDAPAA